MLDLSYDCGAAAETIVFINHFCDLPDLRQAGKVCYPLPEMLLLLLIGVLAGAETIIDVSRFEAKGPHGNNRFTLRPFTRRWPSSKRSGYFRGSPKKLVPRPIQNHEPEGQF